MSHPDGMALGDARRWLRARVERGAECPCCTQLAKVYRRPMSHVTARVLIVLYRRAPAGQYVSVPTIMRDALPGVAHQGGYATLARHWELMEEAPEGRDDGGRAGYWRLTPSGALFVQDDLVVPKYAHLYDGRCLRLSGEFVGIQDVLGQKFDYQQLMQG